MYDVAIIGGGIFGCVIGKALRKQGKSVVVYDNQEKSAGSNAAACLMKEGWFSGFTKQESIDSLNLLDNLYGIKIIDFTVNKIKKVPVYWCNPKKILSEPKHFRNVDFVGPVGMINGKPDHYRIVFKENYDEFPVEAKKVIVAAGIWSNKFTRIDGLIGKSGISFMKEGELQNPFISIYAPYKQAVGFNISPNTIWFGDGSSILTRNWCEERETISVKRACEYLKAKPKELVSNYGIRPFVPNTKPCYLEKQSNGVWVATGGAKNGTLAAAWCALKLIKELE